MEKKKWYENKMLVRLFLVLFYPVGLYGFIKCPNKPKKTMIIMSVIIGLMIIGGIVGEDEKTEKSSSSAQVEKKEIKNKVEYDINQIDVTFDAQDVINSKQKIVVWVMNNSKFIFSGNLSVKIKAKVNDQIMGSDMVFIENLNPGQKTYAIIWSKPSSSSAANYEWSSTKFIEDKTKAKNTEDSPYKFIKEKTESGGTIQPKIEFYYASDRNYQKMYDFIKNRKVNSGIFYHAVFVDDEKYAVFSKYPITSMTFDEDQSKHIIATYVYNTQNGYKSFTYYEKNSWESAPKTIK